MPIILSGNKPNTKNHGKQYHPPRALKIPAYSIYIPTYSFQFMSKDFFGLTKPLRSLICLNHVNKSNRKFTPCLQLHLGRETLDSNNFGGKQAEQCLLKRSCGQLSLAKRFGFS